MSSINRRELMVLTGAALAAGVCGCASNGGAAGDAWTGPLRFELGPVSAIKQGGDARWEKSGGFFLVREGAKIFAVSAICSHKHCPLILKGNEYLCDCHGSTFTLAGVVQQGPAFRSLQRFGLAVDAAGNLSLDRTRVFEESQWGEAELKIKAL